jgi:hypothetical protein
VSATEISEDEIDTMVNVFPRTSGLQMTVWVRPRSNERHGPRIKVCVVHGSRMFPHDTVSVTLPPTIRVIPADSLPLADLRAVGDWIRLNEAAIRALWESRIDGVEFARRLRKLP